jgi:amidophosphoribosyltransferase
MNIDKFRYECGIEMARIDSMKTTNRLKIADLIVVGAPLTGIASGRGYAEFFSIEYQQILEKKEGTTRTFILESAEKREAESKRKYIIDDALDLEGKLILLTDDSLVRGITLKNIITKFKNRKVKEIHVRIAAPPIYNRCQYGIDIPTKTELVANNVDITEMAAYFGCDSLEYIPLPTVSRLINKENIMLYTFY